MLHNNIINYLELFIENNFKHILKNIPSHFENKQKKMINIILKKISNACISFSNQEIKIINDYNLKGKNFNFIPEEIRKYIEKTEKNKITVNFKIGIKNITVHLFYFTDSEFYMNVIEKIYMWLFIANEYSCIKCSKNLNIYLYFTQHMKMLPLTIKGKSIIKEINVNTGFTSSCREDSEITIFREEEWFKVFIHETFHNLGMDFSSIDNSDSSQLLFSNFKIKENILCFETYCEVWAEILYIIFLCFFKENKKITKNTINVIENHLKKQVIFSIFQCIKVLKYNNLEFHDLLNDNHTSQSKIKKYKEDTEVLSYYVFKSVLLFYYNNFIEWCMINNYNIFQFKNEKNINFCYFLINLCKNNNKDFLLVLDNISKCNKKTLTITKNIEYNTLRMMLY